MKNNTLSSIDGANALKLDESYELEEANNSFNNFENHLNNQISEETTYDHKDQIDNVSSGISIESASYIENSNLNEAKIPKRK